MTATKPGVPEHLYNQTQYLYAKFFADMENSMEAILNIFLVGNTDNSGAWGVRTAPMTCPSS